MRVFDHRRPDRGPSLEALEASGIAAMPDAGYVVAGSVQGPGGREVWAARFDADHDLLWSRMLGGAFDLHVTAVTALGDDGVLIGGSLNEKQAGFLIALDAQGEPRWTQVLGGSENAAVEVPLALATDAAGNALMAGETIGADQPFKGFVALIAADGQPGWRLDLPATSGVRSVILTNAGWSIAGESAGMSGAPWVAGLDPTGHLTWERTYEDLAARGAPVLTGLDDGGIVLAAHSAEEWRSALAAPAFIRRRAAGNPAAESGGR
jgi:outer membrane protein assembly factor BamB